MTGDPTIAEILGNDVVVECLYKGTASYEVCVKADDASAVMTNAFGPTCYETAALLTQVFCLGG